MLCREQVNTYKRLRLRPELFTDCLEGVGLSYRGSLNVTWSGAGCLPWDSPDVEDCGFSSLAFPQANLDRNYCRNPDGDVFPWCYYEVSSGIQANCTNWHYCAVQPCADCRTGNGMSYRGEISVTSSGRTCQAWSSQSPHPHQFPPELFPTSGLDENYCRNPDGNFERPWCLTMDPAVTAEYCSVPLCEANNGQNKQQNHANTFDDNVTILLVYNYPSI
ncbi:PLG [Branchiostoma lanceolatum]|uniref:PLG protein n=1 Tax=Branchiostoma lanceolatum TaxID=7740 RepID=A0A8J9YXA0_BRALA|nr:PLG [Branchiostoma lanceolatum]